ncbi:MAG TPA: ribosome silencing factor [Myxococcota bacterium]
MKALDRVAKAVLIAEVAQERKADDVVGLDVRKFSSFADTFIIATGTSDRHVRSVADAIEAALKDRGEPPMGIEGYDEGRWVLIDCADTIVHVFQQEIRDHYDLERLWCDAPALELGVASRSVGT